MRGFACNPSTCKDPCTASKLPTFALHNEKASPKSPRHAPSFGYQQNKGAIFPYILILIFCALSQHASAFAFIGKPVSSGLGFSSRSSEILIDSSIPASATVVRAGHDSPSDDNTMELRKRQMQSPTSPFPTPFDGGLGNNFTSPSCPLFFTNFLNDPNFQACHVVSLLLVTSQSFFQTSRHADSVNRLLDESCSADVGSCKTLMSGYVRTLKSQGGCGADFQAQNPNVMEAYQGFLAYESVYNATCLKSNETNGYCFTDAITNASSPTSSYIYYLPLGIPLPSGTMPACNECLETTMDNYAPGAGNGTLPLSTVYGSAVQQMNTACGPKFITASVPRVTGAAHHLRPPSGLLTALLMTVVAVFW